MVNTAIIKSGYGYNVGYIVRNIHLTAVPFGRGTCFIRNTDRDKIRGLLSILAGYKFDSMIAVRHSAQQPVAEDMRENDVRDYLDGTGFTGCRNGR